MERVWRGMARQGFGGWTVAAALLAMTAGVASCWPQWVDMVSIAVNDPEYSHGLLVPLVALWLAWVRRLRLRRVRPVGHWVGMVLAVVSWLAAWAGWEYGIQALWHAGAVGVVAGGLLSAFGVSVLKQFFPSFLVLVFMVPVPAGLRQAIALPLQEESARLTHFALEAMGFWAERAGNVVYVNQTPIQVAEACNGMRMVFALVLVAFALVFSMPMRNSARLLLLGLTPLVAIGLNTLRLVPTVLLYGYQDAELGDMFHDVSGWVMLPAALGLMMAIEVGLRWASVPTLRFTMAGRAAGA